MSINGIGRPCNWDLLDVDPSYRPNMRAAAQWHNNAIIACETHLWAMQREFNRMAAKHGIWPRDAQLLLMNGISL